MSGRKKLGAWGEKVAAVHLSAHGYEIVAQNWRCPVGEIDIVAVKDDEIAFVEVKTRRVSAYGSAENAITQRKAQKLIELAQTWMLEHDDERNFSIDVIAIEIEPRMGKLVRLDHYEDALAQW